MCPCEPAIIARSRAWHDPAESDDRVALLDDVFGFCLPVAAGHVRSETRSAEHGEQPYSGGFSFAVSLSRVGRAVCSAARAEVLHEQAIGNRGRSRGGRSPSDRVLQRGRSPKAVKPGSVRAKRSSRRGRSQRLDRRRPLPRRVHQLPGRVHARKASRSLSPSRNSTATAETSSTPRPSAASSTSKRRCPERAPSSVTGSSSPFRSTDPTNPAKRSPLRRGPLRRRVAWRESNPDSVC